MKKREKDDYILDEHLLKTKVELVVEEWRQLEWRIMVADRDDFDDAI
jgi:hypothetical protein